ncbi:MAG: hypothetical protein M0D53_04260 [Flavobacterium sp. JAD_PAG50586_2]|nr:MAG: hypothetical protein M0D53_04260 [Flavobacterium sp. JAD_PAG50586_2]
MDKNNLIINYNATNKTFTVKDTNGFTYVFDVKEESASITFSHGVKFNRIDEIAPTSSTSYTYISAFQLSKIFYNQELVVEFIFNTSTLGESQKVVNTTYNTPIEVAGGSPGLQTLLYFLQTGGVGNLLDVILPLYTTQLTTTNTWTKK